ncbi:MAG: purine-binding chemotaxis protein CheW [Spirochaetaceae bacterium]|nr:purine-binding chemotaxis protein CheW [Spirochaetaceae bacterium]
MGTQYLTFTLHDTLYAVEVLQVREVLEYTPPQELPCPDPVIAGLIRSRGQSISVINLRHKFGFHDVEPTKDTRIIVLEVPSDSAFCNAQGQMVFGAIADSVNEVLDLDPTAEEHAPEVGHSIASEFISGIGSVDGKFIILLDMDKVLTFEEQEKIAPTVDELIAEEK